ncbi:hypothetical protein [Noviherbaspirillum soli]|uniref:hypothetical protein n=1 Tax=Noviherbaspirillum soli TaxID=1064518 RepID=UPI00188DAD08|nr:hypothetical protein [Noviherbaspirillum soli]
MIGAGFGCYGRTSRQPENRASSQERASSSPATETHDKQPGVSRSANAIAPPASRRAWQYLGDVTAVGHDLSSSLEKLRTDAYLLTLPTGAQLRLINRRVQPDGTVSPAPNDPVLTRMADLLDECNALINTYNDSKPRPRFNKDKTEAAIRKKLRAMDKALKTAIENPGSSRIGAFQALRNSLHETTTLRGLRTDWRHWEMLGVSPAEFEYAAIHENHLGTWREQGFSIKEALSFKNAGYDPEEVLHLKRTGITGPMAKQLIQRGYSREFFEETLSQPANLVEAGFFLQDHHDAWAENRGREFGSGGCNTVTARFFIDQGRHPDRADSAKAEKIFKPERFIAAPARRDGDRVVTPLELQAGELIAGDGNDSGLPTLQAGRLTTKETLANPRIIGRNLASYRLAKAFGTDVIVESELAISVVPVAGPERAEYQARTGRPAPDFVFMPGVMMEEAKETYRQATNTTPVKPDASSIAGAELYRNLTWLQLVDLVSGQIDRHVGNIRLSADGKVKGIDNDQCWPPKVTESKHFGIYFEGWTWRLTDGKTAFPRIVDEEMVGRLCGFTEAELLAWKAKKLSNDAIAAARRRAKETLVQAVRGCITRAEVKAGRRRLDALQAYLLGTSVKVIADWRRDYAAAAKA